MKSLPPASLVSEALMMEDNYFAPFPFPGAATQLVISLYSVQMVARAG